MVDEAYKLAPQDASTMAAKLEQFERANDSAGLLALSYQMQKLYPINSDPRESRIRLYLKQNQDAKVKAEIDAFQALRPSSPLMTYYRAVLLARAHDKNGAAQMILSLPREFAQSHPEFAVPMAQIMLDGGHAENGAAILGSALAAAPDLLEVRLKLAALRLAQDSPQSALLLLEPVKDSHDASVQKLISQTREKIAKDRAF
jgi:predicted Zn-dependent protease